MLLSRNRSRSRSPERVDRAGLNDRVNRIASSDYRTNMSRRTRHFPCMFFASGNCCCENICWYCRSDLIRNSFNNYKLDDRTQGMDTRVYISPAREGLERSGATLDFNVPVPVPNWVRNEVSAEQRVFRSSADDHAVSDNRFVVHSSSGMSVSEPRGTTFLGANSERSLYFMGNQLLISKGISRKPDFRGTVRSEAAASGQCLRSSEQIPSLTDMLARILEEIKQNPECYAALSVTNALVILQSFVSGCAGPDARAASSRQLDLLDDSIILISEKHAEVVLSKKATDRKCQRDFKFALELYVRNLLHPLWKKCQIDREAFKSINKEVVKKVIFSVQSTGIPQTQESINNYLNVSGPDISMLVQVCADPLKSILFIVQFFSFDFEDLFQQLYSLELSFPFA